MKDRIDISGVLNTFYYIARTRLKPSICLPKARKSKKGNLASSKHKAT